MKTIKYLSFTLLTFSFLMFISCKREVVENLPGTWDMSVGFGPVSIPGTATFNEDATGSWALTGEESVNFTWSAAEETVTLVFTYFYSSETQVFEVVENKRRSQEWKTTIIDPDDPFAVNSVSLKK